MGVGPKLFRDPRFWLALLLAATAALMFDLVLAALARHLSPSDSQVLQVCPFRPSLRPHCLFLSPLKRN